MPKINKSFHLEITVEQFLNACSPLELQEIEIRLDSFLLKAKAKPHTARSEDEMKLIYSRAGMSNGMLTPIMDMYLPDPVPIQTPNDKSDGNN